MRIKVEAWGVRAEGKTVAIEAIKEALESRFQYVMEIKFEENANGSEVAHFDVATMK